jgi:hypothetical protein
VSGTCERLCAGGANRGERDGEHAVGGEPERPNDYLDATARSIRSAFPHSRSRP